MKKILLSILVSLTMISTGYALEAPTDLRVTEVSDTSISLHWSEVKDSAGYYLYYGTKSGSGGSYEVEGVDIIEKPSFLLEELIPDTTYYFAVTTLDEFVSESAYSQELEYATLKAGEKNKVTHLRLIDVVPIDETSIEIVFSKSLNTASESPKEFVLVNQNTGEEVNISLAEVDIDTPNKVIAILDTKLAGESQYQLTVLNIEDEDGGSISYGIDGFMQFITPVFDTALNAATEDKSENTQEESQVEETVNKEEISTWTPAVMDSEESKTVLGNNAWVSLSKKLVDTTVSSVASENKKLPQTGPEHWLLAFVALMLAGGVYMKRKK